jgi:hypothetical protein
MSIDDIHLTQHISFAAPRTRRRPTAPSILRHDAPATVVSAVRCCGSPPAQTWRSQRFPTAVDPDDCVASVSGRAYRSTRGTRGIAPLGSVHQSRNGISDRKTLGLTLSATSGSRLRAHREGGRSTVGEGREHSAGGDRSLHQLIAAVDVGVDERCHRRESSTVGHRSVRTRRRTSSTPWLRRAAACA